VAPPADDSAPFVEIHIVTFPDAAAFAAYRREDPEQILDRISDRFGRLLPTLAGLAASAVLLPVVPLVTPLYLLFIVCVAAQSTISALWTPTAAMVSDGAEGTAAGQAVGVATMNAAWAAGGATGPVLAAWLADAAGFELPFAVAAGLCAASAVVVLVAYRRSRQPQSPATIAPVAERSGP